MDKEGLISAIRARAPWRSVASPMLKLAGIHAGQGWEDTIAGMSGKADLTNDQLNKLKSSLIEHLVVGEKSIRLYKVGKAGAKAIAAKGLSSTPKASDLVDVFPGTLSFNKLKTLGNVSPKYCGHFLEESKEGSQALLFTGSRAYLERVELGKNSLKASALEGDDFESVIGIRNRLVQVYDAIWIPNGSEYICVATDYPASAPHDFVATSHLALEKTIRRILNKDPEPVNLWPAVGAIYDSKEGEVVELGFVTDDDSVKHLKARRGAKCLRQDLYHKAGADEVGDNLSPFKVAVRWQLEHAKGIILRPELTLPGTARVLFSGKGQLFDAVLRNSLNIRDLKLVMSKLISML